MTNQEQYEIIWDKADKYDKLIKALDKIRAEIESLPNANPSYWHSGDMVERVDVLEIIDEYTEKVRGKE